MSNALDEYQQVAVSTAARSLDRDFRVAILALGLCGEAGEAGELVKKDAGHGHPAAPSQVAKELGDVLWYVAVLAAEYGYTLSDVAKMNNEKLRTRYADGFSTEASINRADHFPFASTPP